MKWHKKEVKTLLNIVQIWQFRWLSYGYVCPVNKDQCDLKKCKGAKFHFIIKLTPHPPPPLLQTVDQRGLSNMKRQAEIKTEQNKHKTWRGQDERGKKILAQGRLYIQYCQRWQTAQTGELPSFFSVQQAGETDRCEYRRVESETDRKWRGRSF